jgi:exoribonuclease R
MRKNKYYIYKNEIKITHHFTINTMTKIIKILINQRDYTNYEFIEPETNNSLNLTDYNFIDPIKEKLFSRDYLSIDDNKMVIDYSYVRESAKIAGVLILSDNKTYGRNKTGKRLLYKCVPDDIRLPTFLVSYDIKNYFIKKQRNKYVVFEFDNWDFKHPHGTLVNTLGDVDVLENFYEYQLYCKSLNISISEFNKSVKKAMVQNISYEDIIINNSNYNIVDRTNDNVFCIDPEYSYDFDDGLSLKINDDNTYTVSIYISNVYVWLDTLNIWNSFSKRVSTIYLPDYRRPMLPTLLSEQLCSLQERKIRFAVVTDFIVDKSGEILSMSFNNCSIIVKKNYIYEDNHLLKRKDYNILLSLAQHKDRDVMTSHDLISYWMKVTNIRTGIKLYEKKIGIFRSVKYIENMKKETKEVFNKDTLRVINNWNNITGQYINYDDGVDIKHELLNVKAYVQITSPIRRLVDLLNQMMFMHDFNLIDVYSQGALNFLDMWLKEIDYINNSMRSIRKIQSECNILNLCTKNPEFLDRQYTGIVFDKIKKSDGTFNYMVYLEEIKTLYRYICPTELDNYSKHKFNLYLFYNEDKYKKKIRVQHI